MEIIKEKLNSIEPKIATKCLICSESIPIVSIYDGPKICPSCKKAVMEARILVSEIKKYNPRIAEIIQETKDGV